MRRAVAAAYVEKLLAEVSEGGPVETDADGDYPVRYRSAKYFVRVVGDAPADVHMFAVAVDRIEPSPELLADINEVNAKIRFARVFHVRGQVLVESDIVGEAIEPSSFFTACSTVARITDQFGRQLAAKHGGTASFEDSKDPEYSSPPLTGMYL